MNNVLLIYKKSIYQIYFMEQRKLGKQQHFAADDIKRLKAAHDAHQEALKQVQEALGKRNITFRSIYRARQMNYDDFDFVISVGGDGTLIEAARRTSKQSILGVNSDPERSEGFFCGADAETVDDCLDDILTGKLKPRALNRMTLEIDGQEKSIHIMNDILIAHQVPAAMSRYSLRIGDQQEAQRGSGLWVSTATGSTGAILSAGGKKMPLGSKRLQYLPRELYAGREGHYELKGGIVNEEIEVESAMREGMIYLDGCHCRFTFGFGQTARIKKSPFPLKLIMTGNERVHTGNGS